MSAALARIRDVVPTDRFVVLDTETTGIDYGAEIVQIGIIDPRGETLIDTLVRPTRSIPPDATAIHGITDAMAAGAPTMPDLKDAILEAIRGRTVVIYNAEYDMRLLHQSMRAHRQVVNWREEASRWLCAMLAYAEYRGEPGRRSGEFKWHRLDAAVRHEGLTVVADHSAIGDCRATLALVRRMAESIP